MKKKMSRDNLEARATNYSLPMVGRMMESEERMLTTVVSKSKLKPLDQVGFSALRAQPATQSAQVLFAEEHDLTLPHTSFRPTELRMSNKLNDLSTISGLIQLCEQDENKAPYLSEFQPEIDSINERNDMLMHVLNQKLTKTREEQDNRIIQRELDKLKTA